MLCDTYSVSSSCGVTVTLVQVREQYRPLTNPRGVLRRLHFAWRLFRGKRSNTPAVSHAAGTGPLASHAAACFGMGVRRPLTLRDDWYELMLLLPESMRHTC